MSSNQSGEGEIRRKIIEGDLVDCMIALPGQLFYGTPIPACLWFLARSKKNDRLRDRNKQTLFIDARKLGYLVDRAHREFTDEEILRIARAYHAWRGTPSRRHSRESGNPEPYKDVPGFCKSVELDEIAKHGCVLTPGRYVGTEEQEEDPEAFEEKMKRLTVELAGQFKKSDHLESEIKKNLKGLGHPV